MNEAGDRLDSWKAIAAHLRRTERTARRWEQTEGLPVHRLMHQERSSIYAYKSELDAWLEARGVNRLAADGEVEKDSRRRVALAAAAALLILIGAAAYWLVRHGNAPPTAFSRLDSPVAEEPLSRDPEAVRHFLRGIGFSRNPGRSQILSAIDEFRAALERDPDFADAHGSLAVAYVARMFFSEGPPRETIALAQEAARRALALDPQAVGGHMALGGASHWHHFDHAAAERHYRAAIAAAPREAGVRNWYAEFLIEMRRFDDAIAANREASELDPGWLEIDVVRGNILLFQGRAGEAISFYEQALKKEPSHGLAHYFLGLAYVASDRPGKAISELELANQAMGNVPFSMAALAFAHARAGQDAVAREMLRDFQHKRDAGYYPAFTIAMAHAGLGDRQQALDWLERAADEGLVGYYQPSVELIWIELRDEPRFRRLLSRLRLPERTT